MKRKTVLPMYGIGPVYVGVILALTAAAFFCRGLPAFAAGGLPNGLRWALSGLGVVLMLLGVSLWIGANLRAKIDDGIRDGRLVTTGVYAWVRNPIYSAFLFLCSGAVLMIGNWLFFSLPLLYWLLEAALVRATEEKWLRERFGAEYGEYCRRVNRCIPWRR